MPSPRPEQLNGFEEWYRLYPRRQARVDAERAWAKLKPGPELIEQLLEVLPRQIRGMGWDGDKKPFIPLPASYLNGRRWEDDFEEKKAPRLKGFEACRAEGNHLSFPVYLRLDTSIVAGRKCSRCGKLDLLPGFKEDEIC